MTKHPSKSFSDFDWMAPGLVRAGLLSNGGWVTAHAVEAESLFKNARREVRLAAIGMAAIHQHGLDYIKQAVVLPMAALAEQGGDIRTMTTRSEILTKFRDLCRDGVKLRTMMAAYNLPLQLRDITNVHVAPHFEGIKALAVVDPSTLAQAIPPHPIQPNWANGLAQVHNHTSRNRRWVNMAVDPTGRTPAVMTEVAVDRVPLLRWFALAFSRYMQRHIDPLDAAHSGITGTPINDIRIINATDIMDYAMAKGDQFNFNATWEQAYEASILWHRETAERRQEEGFFGRYGLKFDQPVDYAPLPDSFTLDDGIECVAMRSGLDLYEEGRAMHHCVGGYSIQVIQGSSRIYSIRRDGKSEATLELVAEPVQWTDNTGANYQSPAGGVSRHFAPSAARAWKVNQLKGPTNHPVTKRDLNDAVKKLVAKVNECEREAALGANSKDGKKAGGERFYNLD